MIVLGVEGETEKSYFDHIKELLHNPAVQVRVIPSSGGKSAPVWMLKNIKDFMRKFDVGEGDSFWVVFDKDHNRIEAIKKLEAELRKGVGSLLIRSAISCPRFEIWLLLHFAESIWEHHEKNGLEKELKKYLPGYRHGVIRHVERITVSHIEMAMKRAGALDLEPENPDPPSPCTRVYQPVREIMGPRGGR